MRRGRGLFIAGAACLVPAAVLFFALGGYETLGLCFFGLGACLALYGLVLRHGAKLWGVALTAVLALGCAAFLYAEVPILRAARSDADTDAPYLIVMGAAVHGSVPSMSMVERTDAAVAWLDAHPDGIAVVSGGQGHGEDMTEARAMADYMLSHGVPEERILLEERATSSYENILFSKEIIEEHSGGPAGRVALCSSEYHMFRLRYIAASLGLDPVAVTAKTGLPVLRLNYFIREALAMWKCYLFGIA